MFSTLKRKVVTAIVVSAVAIGFIAGKEGFVDHTYIDIAGVKTKGYGHTGSDVKIGDKITRQEAEALLVKDANKHWNAAKKYIKVPLYQHEADAYASFIFNVGVTNFKNSTLLKKLNAGDYAGACSQLKRWVYAGYRNVCINGKCTKVRNKPKGLVNRREAEYKMCMGQK